MTVKHISDILGKLGELRDLFVLGQRALPFLEEVFTFLEEITPLLDEINASMQDTTSKMPRAASQLQSVSQATELATTEILDLIDAVLARTGQEKERLQQAAARVSALGRADEALLALLREAGLAPEVMADVEVFHAEKEAAYAALAHDLSAEVAAVDEVREKINHIMISLQVQDITTQQIAAVNHLIESIRRRMDLLVRRLGDTKYQELADTLPHPGTFDANARYEWSGRRQSTADDIVTAYRDDAPVPAGPTSQQDIDQLFAGTGAGTGDGQASAFPTPASQDDIDALFGAPSTPASQDDIDALFGGG